MGQKERGFRMSERDRNIDETMASLMKGMLFRGDDQSDIAAFFLVNSGRISEINTGQRFLEVRPMPIKKLPPLWKASAYELWLTRKWP